jgi:hypothetical protein
MTKRVLFMPHAHKRERLPFQKAHEKAHDIFHEDEATRPT